LLQQKHSSTPPSARSVGQKAIGVPFLSFAGFRFCEGNKVP
jgi:hypothetical protein